MIKLPLGERGGDKFQFTHIKQGKVHVRFLGELTHSNAICELEDANAPQKTEHQQDTRQP